MKRMLNINVLIKRSVHSGEIHWLSSLLHGSSYDFLRLSWKLYHYRFAEFHNINDEILLKPRFSNLISGSCPKFSFCVLCSGESAVYALAQLSGRYTEINYLFLNKICFHCSSWSRKVSNCSLYDSMYFENVSWWLKIWLFADVSN